MFGMEMALEALGIDPEVIKAQVAGVVETAQRMEARQIAIDEKVNWIVAVLTSAKQAAEANQQPEIDPAQPALDLETTQNAG